MQRKEILFWSQAFWLVQAQILEDPIYQALDKRHDISVLSLRAPCLPRLATATSSQLSGKPHLDTGHARICCIVKSRCYYPRMRSSALETWLLTCGAAICSLGIGLAFYAESPGGAYYAKLHAETWCSWVVLVGLLAMLLGAAVWGIRTTVKRCLLAALCTAAAGGSITLFGRINIEGATAIFLPVIYAAALSAFLLAVIALVRHFKPKIGQYAYLLALLSFVLVGIALFVDFQMGKPNEGPPKVETATTISDLIKRLPQSAHFSLSGLAFFDGELYVGTNLGLVEVSNGKLARLYQFQSSDSVVSGPWLDRADHLLWATDDHTNELLRFDGSKWARMQEPVPAKGYYSRGDVLEGVRPISNAEGFWLAAGGTAWRWDDAVLKWRQIPLPNPSNYSDTGDVIGVLPIGEDALLIVRHQLLPFLLRNNEDFSSDELVRSGDPAAPLPRDGKAFLADAWTVSGDAGYICTKARKLVRVTKQRVDPLDAPGECEAVATDEDLNLLVSIKSKGIFRYTQGQWTLLAESPYPTGAGEYWTHLSVASGQLAIAIDAQPVVDPQSSGGVDMHFYRNAPTSLWVLKGGKFSLVD
jgi:hypothetical protein